jgi:hypothetical protein
MGELSVGFVEGLEEGVKAVELEEIPEQQLRVRSLRDLLSSGVDQDYHSKLVHRCRRPWFGSSSWITGAENEPEEATCLRKVLTDWQYELELGTPWLLRGYLPQHAQHL